MKFTLLYPKKGAKKIRFILDIVLAFKEKQKRKEQKRVFSFKNTLFKILVFA